LHSEITKLLYNNDQGVNTSEVSLQTAFNQCIERKQNIRTT